MGFKYDISKAFKDFSTSQPQEAIQPVPRPSERQFFPEKPFVGNSEDMPAIKKPMGEHSLVSQALEVSVPVLEAEPQGLSPGQYSAEPTVISANTVVNGDVVTTDPLTVYGEINGSVKCENYLTVSGKIRGNTSGDKIIMNKATLEGDVVCNNDFFISEGTEIVGSVSAMSANIQGKVHGNITARGDVIIGPMAVVTGDVSTGSIEIKKGAFIKGAIIMQGDDEPPLPALAARPQGQAMISTKSTALTQAPPVSAAAAAVQAAMQSVSAAARASQPKAGGFEEE